MFKRSKTQLRKMLIKHTKARAQPNQRWSAHKAAQNKRWMAQGLAKSAQSAKFRKALQIMDRF